MSFSVSITNKSAQLRYKLNPSHVKLDKNNKLVTFGTKHLSARIPKDEVEEHARKLYEFYKQHNHFPDSKDHKQFSEAKTIISIFSQVKEYWRNTKKTKDGQPLRPKTIDSYIEDITNYVLNDKLAKLNLETEVTPLEAISWAKRIQNGISVYTFKNKINAVRALFNDARILGLININTHNPFSDDIFKSEIPKGRTKAGKKIKIHLNDEQIKALTLDERIPILRRVYYLTAILTGLRASELFGLSIGHVGENTIEIERQLNVDKYMKNKMFVGCKEESERQLPLHPTLKVVLKWWIETGREIYLGKKAPNTAAALFPSSTGTYLRPKVSKFIKADLELAGVSSTYAGFPITFHATRRTFATRLTDLGVDEGIVGALMGHSGNGVGDRHYIGRNIKTFAAAIEKTTVEVPNIITKCI